MTPQPTQFNSSSRYGSHESLEHFFLDVALKIGISSIVLVMIVDLLFDRFFVPMSLVVNGSVLLGVVGAFVLHKRGYFEAAVICMMFVCEAVMYYQAINRSGMSVTSMAVIVVIGFALSALLKERKSFVPHSITIVSMIGVFVWQSLHPRQYEKEPSDIVVIGITYMILYLIVAYSAFQLRKSYDLSLQRMITVNGQLLERSDECQVRNEELLRNQLSLSELNNNLERMVEVRTSEVRKQNERLIKYAYANAHHLRGPVARSLGLIQLSRLDANADYPTLFQLLEKQMLEIDQVIKEIDRELQG